MNALEQLKRYTRVVADTGDFESILSYRPVDATTNPSLITAAARQGKYRPLVEEAIREARADAVSEALLIGHCLDTISVAFGKEILKIVPGRVSTEVDARLSFDREATVGKARKLVGMYERKGIERERILIKVAATWEGICAARQLENEGIHCNLTLLFSRVQAIACAQAGVTLISPFVGRILDWYRKEKNLGEVQAADDPGVKSVADIFDYYKKHGHSTEIMGASFRNKGEILALAGCDLLTISPALLKELEQCDESVIRRLDEEASCRKEIPELIVDEKTFRWLLNEDAMATEKLAEGIRKFAFDLTMLEGLVQDDFLHSTSA